jgi:PP-loop superfamily ATP-utilizing enzyme
MPADSLVLVALSGGADSLALAAATAFEAHSGSFNVTIKQRSRPSPVLYKECGPHK